MEKRIEENKIQPRGRLRNLFTSFSLSQGCKEMTNDMNFEKMEVR